MVIDGSKEQPLTPEQQRNGVGAGYIKSQGVPGVEDPTPRNWAAQQRQATADAYADRAQPSDAPIPEAEQRRLNGLAQLDAAK